MYKGKSNIDIVKNYLAGERPFVQVGYSGEHKDRKVGDQWTDGQGVTWEKKAWGIVRVNKQADSIREMLQQKCKCGQVIRWGTKRDELFFQKTGLCENCLIQHETELRILGVYPAYERYKLLSNELGFIEDAKEKLEETIDYIKKDDGVLNVLCNSEGFIEKFEGKNVDGFLKQVKDDLGIFKKRQKVVSKAKLEAKREYVKLCKKNKLTAYVGQ